MAKKSKARFKLLDKYPRQVKIITKAVQVIAFGSIMWLTVPVFVRLLASPGLYNLIYAAIGIMTCAALALAFVKKLESTFLNFWVWAVSGVFALLIVLAVLLAGTGFIMDISGTTCNFWSANTGCAGHLVGWLAFFAVLPVMFPPFAGAALVILVKGWYDELALRAKK